MNSAKEYKIRPACFEDARAIARLIDIAGEGIPNLIWSNMAEPGQSALDVGQANACCDVGGLSYRNALVAEAEGSVVGMILGYIVEQPDEEMNEAPSNLPGLARPFVAHEPKPDGTFYIDALAVLPGWRGCGIGSHLLVAAEQRARNLGATNMSIQHFAHSKNAVKLYSRAGFHASAQSFALSPHCQHCNTGDVELLFKAL